MNEANLMRVIQIEASKIGYRLFRNNVGKFQSKTGQWIKFGLANGSSDLIGFSPNGRFTAVEVKTITGTTTEAQEHFLAAVSLAGGIAFIARDVETAINYLKTQGGSKCLN